uniref:Uncharacterized protein n=1 Tax=Gadus morhua TaxID=8049 RepID=A0A8C5ARD6_GADMO
MEGSLRRPISPNTHTHTPRHTHPHRYIDCTQTLSLETDIHTQTDTHKQTNTHTQQHMTQSYRPEGLCVRLIILNYILLYAVYLVSPCVLFIFAVSLPSFHPTVLFFLQKPY